MGTTVTARALSPEEDAWRNKVMSYPAGVLVGPNNIVHHAPTYMMFDTNLTVRWEYNPDPPPGYGRWSCVETSYLPLSVGLGMSLKKYLK